MRYSWRLILAQDAGSCPKMRTISEYCKRVFEAATEICNGYSAVRHSAGDPDSATAKLLLMMGNTHTVSSAQDVHPSPHHHPPPLRVNYNFNLTKEKESLGGSVAERKGGESEEFDALVDAVSGFET